MSTIPAVTIPPMPAAAPMLGRNVQPMPTWEIALLFPSQGTWTEDAYLDLNTNHLVELSDSNLEVLAMPTQLHQIIVFLLGKLLDRWADQRGAGQVLVAPFKIRLWPGKMREPDVMFMLKANDHRRNDDYWEGADLVMEVISEDDPRRDLVTKRFEYAQAGIPEYWIIDPRTSVITVLALAGHLYQQHGVFGSGQQAVSATLEGFSVDVAAVFAPR